MFQDSECKHWFRDNADMLQLAEYLDKKGCFCLPSSTRPRKVVPYDRIQEKLFEVLSDNTYGLCPAPMSSDVALQILVDYLLGENFYIVMPLSQEQANTEIVAAILDKYSKEYKKDRKKFMKEKGGEQE